jgi:hypothetical protein
MDAMRSSEERLNALLLAFRDCPAPEPSVNFMPELWARIESRQRFSFSLRRMTGAFVTTALALSLALGVYLAIPHSNPFYAQTYVDTLTNAGLADSSDILAPVLLDQADQNR